MTASILNLLAYYPQQGFWPSKTSAFSELFDYRYPYFRPFDLKDLPINQQKKAMSYLTLKDHPYYYRLKNQEGGKGLLDVYDETTLAKGLIVQYEVPSGLFPRSPDLKRLFAAFTISYVSFFSHQEKFSPSHRCFYETILGEYAQKPHFDVDLEIEGSEEEANFQGTSLVGELLTKCAEQFSIWDLPFDFQREVLLFSSHGRKEENGKVLFKRSYHIVINNYCHRNHREAKEFYKLIISKMYHPHKQAIDAKVYSSIQQFRLLDSTKADKNRFKTIVTNFEWKNIKIIQPDYSTLSRHEKFSWLTQSLISNTRDCVYLYVLESDPQDFLDLPEASTEDIQTAIDLLRAWSNDFDLLEVKGSMVTLKRLTPSWCPLCQRVHEAENPYLLIRNEQVLWNCRRNDSFHLLGMLKGKKITSPSLSPKKLDVLALLASTKKNLSGPGYLTPDFGSKKKSRLAKNE